MEPASIYPHKGVHSLGIYKEKPFVTGYSYQHKKTEILDYTSKQWIEDSETRLQIIK